MNAIVETIKSVSASKPSKKTATAPAPATPAPAGFRPAAYPPTARVTIEAAACPKRPGTQAARAWLAYTDAKGKALGTVEAVLARFKELGFSPRYARSALRWDAGHGFIKIEEAKPAAAK